MISSYKEYLIYRRADKIALGRKRMIKVMLFDDISQFQRALRRLEYSKNCPNKIFSFIIYSVCYMRFRRLSRLLGFSIPPNVFGLGLKIMHRGTIIVTPNARIGTYCKINADVQIGPGSDGTAPEIGDNCYIGPGAKIFGDIKLGNNIRIGANAVVNKSFPDNNLLLVGIPAKAISVEC